MRISDWSSDVCSSDLHAGVGRPHRAIVIVVIQAGPAHAGTFSQAITVVQGNTENGFDLLFDAGIQRRSACRDHPKAGARAFSRGATLGESGKHGRCALQDGNAVFLQGLRSEEHTSELTSLM